MPINTVSFYDGFLTKLATENTRHRRVYQALDSLPQGKVLDLGCGAGLTSKRLAEGGRTVLAVDFSPVAIAYAQKHNGYERIQYVCHDITQFKTDDKFDSICLVDILEHLENPWSIANLLRDASHKDTVIYLNIPYSETISYLQENHPKVLQPIDDPDDIGNTLNLFTGIGFVPFKMELYWMQYVEYFFCTKEKFNLFMKQVYSTL